MGKPIPNLATALVEPEEVVGEHRTVTVRTVRHFTRTHRGEVKTMERLVALKVARDRKRAESMEAFDRAVEADIELGRAWAIAHASLEDLELAHHIATGGWYRDERFDRHVPNKETWPRNRFVLGADRVYR